MFEDIERILIIRLSSLGDLIHALPTLAALRRRFPQAFIAWAVEEHCKDILTGNPCLNEIIVIRRHQIARSLKGGKFIEAFNHLRGLYKRLKEGKFDLSLDLQGMAKSALLVCLTRAKYRLASYSTYGVRELSFLFSKTIAPNSGEEHVVERHLATVRYLGGETNRKEFILKVAEEDERYVDNLLGAQSIDNHPMVIISPSAGWPSTQWFKERFAQVADELSRRHKVNIILIGRRNETGLIQEVINLMDAKAINLAGKTTVKQLVALIKRSSLLIGNDSAPLHIAAALGIPTVAIFGRADPARTGPYGDGHIVLRKDLPCSPCRKRECAEMRCMKLIEVEEVLEAAESQLNISKVSKL